MTAASSCPRVLEPVVRRRERCRRDRARRSCLRVQGMAGKDSGDRRSGGRMVDENMIVLRMRIQEMKMAESKWEAPAHWMEWEKRYFASYYSDVCEGVGRLQRFLMSTRPGMALGMLVLLGCSLPISLLAVLLYLIK
ncbi:unnamed protein product [Victoria cruziana]